MNSQSACCISYDRTDLVYFITVPTARCHNSDTVYFVIDRRPLHAVSTAIHRFKHQIRHFCCVLQTKATINHIINITESRVIFFNTNLSSLQYEKLHLQPRNFHNHHFRRGHKTQINYHTTTQIKIKIPSAGY